MLNVNFIKELMSLPSMCW